MKIAILTPQLSVGGAEIDMCYLANNLYDYGHDINLYTYCSGPLERILKIQSMDMPNRLSDKFDLVIVMGPDVFRKQLLQFKKPIINYVCNITPGYFSATIRDKYKFAAHLVDSQNTYEFVYNIDKNIHIINNWYYMRNPDCMQVQPDYKRYGVSESQSIVGTICKHRLVKNIPRLIDVFKKANIDNAIFIIGGDGPETKRWKLYGQNILGDKCKFVEAIKQDDLGAFYSSIDVFLNQYVDFAGGRCLTSSEASAAGCYIITNQYGGAKENILVNNGCVINDNIFDDIAPQKLKEFFGMSKQDRQILRNNAKQHYVQLYKNQFNIGKYLDDHYS